jgi:hypothetical protein
MATCRDSDDSGYVGYPEVNAKPMTLHAGYAASRIRSKLKGSSKQFGWLQVDTTKDKRSNSAATAIRGGDHYLLYGLTLPLSNLSQWAVRAKTGF